MDGDERTLYARISAEAHAGWLAFADEHGVTIAALAEALGERFADPTPPTPPGEDLIRRARQIAAERRRRD